MDRPTFYYENQPVRAAGMLFQHGDSYLLRRCKGKWSDIGGKTDAKDNCILDTMVREVVEETNGQLFGNDTFEEASKKLFAYLETADFEVRYAKRSKYLLFIVQADFDLKTLDTERFGAMEGNMKHEYKWLRTAKNLNYRLKELNIL
tara:strand:+ start:1166 stop:1606 length:441 start_codon:yes stop_codon:yes gene_type:complete